MLLVSLPAVYLTFSGCHDFICHQLKSELFVHFDQRVPNCIAKFCQSNLQQLPLTCFYLHQHYKKKIHVQEEKAEITTHAGSWSDHKTILKFVQHKVHVLSSINQSTKCRLVSIVFIQLVTQLFCTLRYNILHIKKALYIKIEGHSEIIVLSDL